MGSNLTTIGAYAFSGCTSLKEITLPTNLKAIDDYTFSSSGITIMKLRESIETIGTHSFERCVYMNTIYLGPNITNIGYYAFYQCSSLMCLFYSGEEEPTFGSNCFASALASSVNCLGDYQKETFCGLTARHETMAECVPILTFSLSNTFSHSNSFTE